MFSIKCGSPWSAETSENYYWLQEGKGLVFCLLFVLVWFWGFSWLFWGFRCCFRLCLFGFAYLFTYFVLQATNSHNLLWFLCPHRPPDGEEHQGKAERRNPKQSRSCNFQLKLHCKFRLLWHVVPSTHLLSARCLLNKFVLVVLTSPSGDSPSSIKFLLKSRIPQFLSIMTFNSHATSQGVW